MHARMGELKLEFGGADSVEPGVAVMGVGTSPNAIVAAGAPVQVDEHGGGAIDRTPLDKKLEQLAVHFRFEVKDRGFPFLGEGRHFGVEAAQFGLREFRNKVALDDGRRDRESVDVPDGSQGMLVGVWLASLPLFFLGMVVISSMSPKACPLPR